MRAMLRILYTGVVIFLTGLLLAVNLRLYADMSPSEKRQDVTMQLAYLESALEDGAGGEMQRLYPEGYFFMHTLYGLSWTQVADDLPVEASGKALKEARWALRQLESADGRRVFEADLAPSYGIFYAGWRSRLRGKILLAQQSSARDSNQVDQFKQNCREIAEAFQSRDTPFPPSYPRAAWPADALVAVSALRLHDRMYPSEYGTVVKHWLSDVKHRLDPATGLLPHEVSYRTGEVLEGTRGSSQVLILRLLHEIDTTFAKQQYRRFKRHFLTTRGGLPGVREYPRGTEGTGDIDSGPVVFDIGAAATIVGVGTTQIYGDRVFSQALQQTIEALGFPLSLQGKKRYLNGFFPIGDAFLVWSKTARPRFWPDSSSVRSDVVKEWWRWPTHGFSALIVLVGWLWVFRQRILPFRRYRYRRRRDPS